jgi:hypothetical protein
LPPQFSGATHISISFPDRETKARGERIIADPEKVAMARRLRRWKSVNNRLYLARKKKAKESKSERARK